jgi:hypothetical protein
MRCHSIGHASGHCECGGQAGCADKEGDLLSPGGLVHGGSPSAPWITPAFPMWARPPEAASRPELPGSTVHWRHKDHSSPSRGVMQLGHHVCEGPQRPGVVLSNRITVAHPGRPSSRPPRWTARPVRMAACPDATARRAAGAPPSRRCPSTAQDPAVLLLGTRGTRAPATADGPPASTRTSVACPSPRMRPGTGPLPCRPRPRARRSSTTAARPSGRSADRRPGSGLNEPVTSKSQTQTHITSSTTPSR